MAMFGKNSILAFIPARAGSRGLRHKNTRSFAGKPLVCWTIDAARGSKYIDRTLVSTDGARIARVARAAGADVPFMRPAALATDSASALHAIWHATDWLAQNEGRSYDYVIMLQPTSPLRSAQNIDQAIEYYFSNRKTERDTLVSVTIAPKAVPWLLVKNTNGFIDFCFPVIAPHPQRQASRGYYLPNGAIFLGPIGRARKRLFYTARTLPFIMPENVSVDIDTKEDFTRALELFNLQK